VGGHSESVNLTLSKPAELDEVRQVLAAMPGVAVQDDINNNDYPMPLQAQGKDEVFVGRLRKDTSQENGLNLWIVADNLRKGAATNTVQIAEYLAENNLI
jgi:aspartate-semialdehyde dehydrogenase